MTGLDAVIERKEYRVAATGRDLPVLEGVKLHLSAGEFVCILGPSGCGKSTLLQILAGLDAGFEGQIKASGRLGVMFQTPRLMPWLTVRENLDLVADESARADGRAEQLLRNMRLESFAGTHPGRLSGGMQRRVSLARACLNRPELLLLDEPFVSLDAPTAAELRDWLLAEWQASAAAGIRQTILCLTHDLREALTLADRVLFLSPRPASVVLEHSVDLPRPRAIEGAEVAALRDSLLRRWPNLLSGDVA